MQPKRREKRGHSEKTKAFYEMIEDGCRRQSLRSEAFKKVIYYNS